MKRSALCFLLISLFPALVSGGELLDFLKNYEGRWVGDFSIHSTANEYTERFSVEQRYWWKGEVLHGLAVSMRKSGMESTTSRTWVEDKKLIAEIKRGEIKEVYYGVLHDGGLLWVPVDLQRANDHQMRDLFVEEAGKPKKMVIEGFDTYVYKDGLAHLVYKGKLTLESGAEEEE